MQKTHIFLSEALKNVAIGLLLRNIQRINITGIQNFFIQTSYLLMIDLKDFLFDQSVKNGNRTS